MMVKYVPVIKRRYISAQKNLYVLGFSVVSIRSIAYRPEILMPPRMKFFPVYIIRNKDPPNRTFKIDKNKDFESEVLSMVVNPGVLAMIQNLSETAVIPIAGMILTFILCYELIQVIIQKNNMHDIGFFDLYKWFFKAFCAVFILTHTFDIVMFVFALSQHAVNASADAIADTLELNAADALIGLEAQLQTMGIWELMGFWLETFLINICLWALTIVIFVIIYGRMIEIFLVVSVAPIPLSTFANREWSGMGNNYLKSLFALAFQGFLIMVCVAIYAALVQNIPAAPNIRAALYGLVGYTILLAFALMKAVGEWLTLPADADTLRGLFERIGVDRPSEGAFAIAAVRMPMEDLLRSYVTKHDSLDEINMLASYMSDMQDYELDKLNAILTHKIADIGDGTGALINLLGEDNFDAFVMIDASDYEALGRYYTDDKPDDVSFSDFGRQNAEDDKGVFTEWGYVYHRYGEMPREYAGVVPDEYKILEAALQGLRPKPTAQEKPSVMDEIKAARRTPGKPQLNDAPKLKKGKGEQDL